MVCLLAVAVWGATRGQSPQRSRVGAASPPQQHPLPSSPPLGVAAVPLTPAAVTLQAVGDARQEAPAPATPRPARIGTLRLQVSRRLSGPFSYWFVAASEQASTPQPLPAQDTQGRVSLTIPAAYNHAGAQVRVLDQSLGKVARLPVTDFSRPETVVDPQVGANVLRDAGMADGTRVWTLEHSGPRAQGTLQTRDALEGPVGVAGPVLRLDVRAVGTQNWHVQCYQTGVRLQEGASYQFAFWAKADHARPLSVSAILDRPDWHTLGLSGQVSLTPAWQKYVVPFTARHCVANHGRVSFLLGDAQGTVHLAGITLRRGNGGRVTHLRAPTSALELTPADFH